MIELLAAIGGAFGLFVLILMTADLMASMRYNKCPKCGHQGKENTFDSGAPNKARGG